MNSSEHENAQRRLRDASSQLLRTDAVQPESPTSVPLSGERTSILHSRCETPRTIQEEMATLRLHLWNAAQSRGRDVDSDTKKATQCHRRPARLVLGASPPAPLLETLPSHARALSVCSMSCL